MRKSFLTNIFLAFSWTLLTGRLDFWNFLEGLLFGFIILYIVRDLYFSENYSYRLLNFIYFIFYVIYEVIVANLQVAYDVITPGHRIRPGVVGVPLDVKTNFEITLLANIITMTPGTLSLDVSEDKKILYVHTMFMKDPESFRQSIKSGLEKRILEFTR